MNDIEFNSLSRVDINTHLQNNNDNLKVAKNTSEGIIVSNIEFDAKSISFDNKKDCTYKLIDTKSQQIQANTIKRIKFENCEFDVEPIVTNEDIFLLEFYNCVFNSMGDLQKNLLSTTHENKQVYFYDCKFDKFQLGGVQAIMYNSNVKLCKFFFFGGEIDELTIENIEIASKFYINKQYDDNSRICEIKRLYIYNSIFKENFKLHNCEINEIEITDTDFEKNADFYKSHFKSGKKNQDNQFKTEINFKALNFKELALFGDTKFDKKFNLKYVTLKGYSHFRNAIFKEGLDLDYTNTQNPMNFFGVKELDSKISKDNTSQETYRTIKYNFEALENIIEANKYHVLELEKHREYIWSQDTISFKLLGDGIVSLFHRVSSNHSSNWFLALCWIIIVSICTNLYLCNEIKSIENILKYVNILSNIDDFKDSYTVMTLNKISLGYLYYQFVTAVRKDTRKK
ncbi:hypothetical protein [Aliarcobacter butzleri]|uniref:hypothetical protein n=1 Tax=Aliarcobacter butzleri TaxID=28197 RepID=UPI00263E80FE|nr:hypothetical protein [Aliarcobacter butzleri]MDN5048581.1 hypothetical protein [Aliarcobacter butzleri]MDN5056683.1 hypothetical protein [Aliarcobacter butzleri]